MKLNFLPSLIVCSLLAAPVYAGSHSSSRSSSSPMMMHRSPMGARTAPMSFNRNLAGPRNFSGVRNASVYRSTNVIRNTNAIRSANTHRSNVVHNSGALRSSSALRNSSAYRNSSAFRNSAAVRNTAAARAAALNRNRHHRTRYVFVNYSSPWYGYGWDWGWPYYDYYPYYYGYGPSVNFSYTDDGYNYDPYMYNYGNAPSYYSDPNAYDSAQPQPEYRDRNYNVGNASMVSRVQAQLKRDGYYKGDVDGALGSRTKYAIRAYQRDHGLEASGTMDEDLLRTMGLR